MKASNIVTQKKISKEKPDLEEAIDESDDGEDPIVAKGDDEEEDLDLSKDKYVKQAKKKAATKKASAANKPSAAAKKKAKAKVKAKVESDEDEAEDVDDSDSEEIVKSTKGKGKVAAKGRKR